MEAYTRSISKSRVSPGCQSLHKGVKNLWADYWTLPIGCPYF